MRNHIKIYSLAFMLLSLAYLPVIGQVAEYEQENIPENIKGKGRVADASTIRLRWAPTSPNAWLQGRNYGYSLERYTVMIDGRWQDNPAKVVLSPDIKVLPLPQWESHALQSDYAAVIAQAFYGEDFELNATANDVGSIINRSSELEQRFVTSVFMAEYDYTAAEMAGWAYTDDTANENEKYLYRVILNRPVKQEGDTAAIFIGFADKKDLLPPMELRARWGDRSVILSWNYELRAKEYHSYHIERKVNNAGTEFERITNLPITVLNADMQDAFHIDTLQNNEIEYSYRIVGLTSFGEEGPPSNIITGRGEKQVSCIPQIYAGEFISEDKAEIYWEFACEEIELVDKLQLVKSDKIDGNYTLFIDQVDKQKKYLLFDMEEPAAYLKLLSINTNNTQTESFPFRLQRIDSIPPAIPSGLEVSIDSSGVAHLMWNANMEPDLQGYRILRSFAEGNEKSVLTPQLIADTCYADTLSLNLKNEKVYYSLTALDMRYNESEPCREVAAVKPNNATLFHPFFTEHETVDGKVRLEWTINPSDKSLAYTLGRMRKDSITTEVLYTGDYTVNSYTDEPGITGVYEYTISVKNRSGQESATPIPLSVYVETENKENKVSGFRAYVNEKDNCIELSWKKHPEALLYRIYRAEENEAMSLWREADAENNRIIDERLSPNTTYTYTILFTTQTDGLSMAASVSVDY